MQLASLRTHRSNGANMDLTKPTIHLNGTSRDVLRDQYEAAWIAVDEAID